MAKDISKMIINIESEEHFQELVELSDTKVVIIDCFSEWCGPCVSLNKRLANLSGDFIECVRRRFDLAPAFTDQSCCRNPLAIEQLTPSSAMLRCDSRALPVTISNGAR